MDLGLSLLSELIPGAAHSFWELHEDGVAPRGRGSTRGVGGVQSESRGLGLWRSKNGGSRESGGMARSKWV